MPSENVSWREEISINIKGGIAKKHEIPVDVLMESLTGLQQIVNRTSGFLYGKDTNVSVKIKGGFIEGSFDFKAVLDFFAPYVPFGQQIVDIIMKMIEYKKFTGGNSPAEIIPQGDGQSSIVKNNSGNTSIFQNNVIFMAGSSQADSAINKLFYPLKNGAKKMEVGDGNPQNQPVVVTEEEQAQIFAAEETAPSVSDKPCVVEILTAQMDGRSTGWRFYDIEDGTEFSAGVADHQFLNDVNEGRYAVLRHKHAHALMRVEKQKINFRNRTTRTILRLKPMTDKEELQFT